MITIIDYNAGNVQSVIFALKRLGVEAVLTNDIETIQKAEKVIFPGVGEASTTMNYLQQLGLDKVIPNLTQPVLGICLGMQLLCDSSEENDTKCLGVFPQKVVKFEPKPTEKVKVPHVGWNTIFDLKNGFFDNALENEYVYFVHSFYAELNEFTVATTNYIQPFSAALQKDNFYAAQFHPEKSGKVGEQIIKNFLELKY